MAPQRPPRPDVVPSPGPSRVAPRSLLERLVAVEVRAAVTFAGQATDPLDELAALLVAHPGLRPFVAAASAHLEACAASPEGAASGRFRHGLDVLGWADDPEGAPDERYRRTSAVSHPLILLTQLTRWQALWQQGLDAAWAAGAIVAVTGHSQGILAALAVAETPGGALDDARVARFLTLAVLQGGGLGGPAHTVPGPDGQPVTPMAALGGITAERLAPVLAHVNAGLPPEQAVVVALRNTATRLVVSGPPSALARLHAELLDRARREEHERNRGRRGGTPLAASWTPLGVELPFHHPLQAPHLARFLDRARPEELVGDGASLAVPVASPTDGHDLCADHDLLAAAAAGEYVAPVRWDQAVDAVVADGVQWVLDLGPGTDVARMTAEHLQGHGARVLALASPEAQRLLVTPGAAPDGPERRYATLAPGLVALPDGRVHVDNRYTRATGRPPVVLAGMTPTTTDVAIVAAAANAGYTAELAGGGQRTAEVLRRRLVELGERLDPGVEVVFNALHLDRALWDVHLGREAQVPRARRRGVPLAGVTVSAGVPDVEEGVALLDAWAAEGLVQNAFKPGTVDQVRQVLAIADAARHHTVVVHLEGGKGGGHHSWEDLEELLLATYHDLRLRPHVVLCAGGGVATPERAATLLRGDWALRHGRRPMPVDGVLLGTVAMATAEAAASPAVKAALVAATGTTSWVARRGADGGVTSGRSHLGADIHCLDNAAAHAGHLLDELAGDPAAVAARHDEVVAALAATAKPWFGDLATMTYDELLRRFAELCAGRHGRYDDGAWGDPHWRSRALALYRRAQARLAPVDEGPVALVVATLADLDDPAAAHTRFLAAHPAAATTRVHPADAADFVERCDERGRPVPFVPVLDGEVRRWYMADALWQAQDDRYDADAVLVIPGPEAVAGITRPDEPVADLLARFEAGVVDALAADGVVPVRRDRLTTTGLAPAPWAALAEAHPGVVAALVAAPSLVVPDVDGGRRTTANPLWRLAAPGDTVATTLDAAGVLVRVEVRPQHGGDEALVVAAQGDDVVVRVVLPGVARAHDELVLRVRCPRGAQGPFHLEGSDEAFATFHRKVLTGPAEHEVVVAADGLGATGRFQHHDHAGAAYRAATGASHDGVPLDVAASWTWPLLAALLADGDLAVQLERLVHTEHHVAAGPAWPPLADEAGVVNAAVHDVHDTAAGRTITLAAEARSHRGVLSTVHATLQVLAPFDTTPIVQRRHRHHQGVLVPTDDAALDLLVTQPWWHPMGPPVAAGDALRLDVRTTLVRPRQGPGRASALGHVRLAATGVVVATVDLAHEGDEREHPVDVVLEEVAPPVDARHDRPRRRLATAEDVAPASLAAFALVGGDHNPLHRCVLAARLAGLGAPIVHGTWVAARAGAFVVDTVAAGDAERLRSWRVRFSAPVALGARLRLEAHRVGVEDGGTWVEVVVLDDDDRTVALGEALVAAAPTVWTFPGQGVQHVGMGRAGRDRSRAATEAWARAEAHCRGVLGFSLREVVDTNPTSLRLADGTVLRHPAGVLFLTELTQVALVALAGAQVAELHAEGALGPAPAACGHSVGEFAALVALGALPLEAALELVFARGRAMQACVVRDGAGRSPHRLAAVDPAAAGLGAADLVTLVAAVAAATGDLLEVVNHNAPDRQHVVAGTERTLAELARRLGPGRDGRTALRPVPGVDVPFHSTLLRPAVDAFRPHLERLVGPVDPSRLVGRWVPNLVGRPFSLDAGFVEEVAAATGERLEPGPADDPAARASSARSLLVALLAHQLAAPVQWVATQQALVLPSAAGGLGATRIVEVGPSPVLTPLARTSLPGLVLPGGPPELLHVEADHDLVFGVDLDPAPDEAEPATSPAPPVAPTPTPTPSPSASAAPVRTSAPHDDVPLDAAHALRLVLAFQARVRPDELRPQETIDELFQGVSSRRNQVLIDLGRELGLSGTEGVQDVPLERLEAELHRRAGRYRYPGAYLGEAVGAGLTRALGRSGLSRRDALAHLAATWGLGPGLAERTLATLVLDTRPGASARDGELARLGVAVPTGAEAGRALLDRAAALVADELGRDLHPATDAAGGPEPEGPGAGGPRGGPAPRGATTAALAQLLAAIDPGSSGAVGTPLAEPGPDPSAERLAVLDAELGPDRAEEVRPRFDHRRHVAFTTPWAAARWDLVTGFHDALAGRLLGADLDVEVDRLAVHATDPAFARLAGWLAARASAAGRPEVADALGRAATPTRSALPLCSTRPVVVVDDDGEVHATEVADPDEVRLERLVDAVARGGDGAPVRVLDPAGGPGPTPAGAALADELASSRRVAPDRCDEVVLVTGASPGSIAEAVVRRYLCSGATVVVATSTDTPERRAWYRALHRQAAGPGAALHVVPANLASFTDVDDLVGWLDRPEGAVRGRPDLALGSLVPTVVVPFAATTNRGQLDEAGAPAEVALRVQLLGLERLVAGVAALVARRAPERRVAVLLPLSPNHGHFGGDGAYAETKAALAVLRHRVRSEPDTWGRHVSVLATRIGWVRGTHLMAANDVAAALVEEHLGVRTFSAAEVGWVLAGVAAPAVRAHAVHGTLDVELTGGLEHLGGLRTTVAPLVEALVARAGRQRRRAELRRAVQHRLHGPDDRAEVATVAALPSPAAAVATSGAHPSTPPAPDPAGLDPADLVVIVGVGELGPLGSGRTRFELEATGTLGADGVAEAAWLCGLVRYERDGYRGRWVDVASGEEVPEEDLAGRYRTAVLARLGVRPVVDDGVVDPAGTSVLTTVHLEHDLSFDVEREDVARSFLAAEPGHTTVVARPEGGWRVTRAAGSPVRVGRTAPPTRRVAGQLPTGLDLARHGVPPDLLATVDRLAALNLVCTAAAFHDAGLEPEELLGAVHPALVANSQGAGFGGMASLRRLLLDHLLEGERQPDRLQESLINVVAGHVVQSYVGSYGAMTHPVAACATAAVSLEVAFDQIRSGRALAVVAGGYDDLTPEGMLGFADMHATASSDELEAMGLAPHEASRANDVRRRGFVEAQGGGALLVVRGDVAVTLGLPVRGVLAYVGSAADGIHTSIPAPGMGLLSAGRGGAGSPLATALGRLGLGADDIALVSKHDTSTELNDPNEADLHQRLADALGRTPGNPLLVVSQKAVTGHAKGGAAAWQVHGVLQVMEQGVVPGNPNLEALDPALAPFDHLVHGDRPIRLAPGERATVGLVTSLGFGHVSALVALAHPDVFLATLDPEARAAHLRRAGARRAWARQRQLDTRLGRPGDLRRAHRRLGDDDPTGTREHEAELLLDAGARLGPDGSYGRRG